MNGKIRIRTASRISLLVTGILSALCLAISLLGVQKYTELRNITKEMVNCQNIIENLQSSSNTLTRQVRLAAMTGNNHYVDTYFTELSKVDTYEAALQKLSAPLQHPCFPVFRKKNPELHPYLWISSKN